MTHVNDELASYLGSPIVRRRELEALGLAGTTVSRRCRSGGPWQRLLPGIVLLHNGPVGRDDRRRAALLHAGPGAVITGLDALQCHGLERMPHPSGAVHVLVPLNRRRSGTGLVLVERTERLPDSAPGRWPLAPPARAALDAARRLRDRTVVRALLAEVVQRGRCSPADLVNELLAGSRRGTATPRLVLHEIADGVRSAAEAQARQLVNRSGLPRPLWNARLHGPDGRFFAIPDAWFDDVAMAWEIDSVGWHLSPDDYARTLDRRSAMTSAGVVVVHTLPSRLRERPADVVRELRTMHASAAGRPRPLLRATTALP